MTTTTPLADIDFTTSNGSPRVDPECLAIQALPLDDRVSTLQRMLADEASRYDENGQPDRAWLLQAARLALAEQQRHLRAPRRMDRKRRPLRDELEPLPVLLARHRASVDDTGPLSRVLAVQQARAALTSRLYRQLNVRDQRRRASGRLLESLRVKVGSRKMIRQLAAVVFPMEEPK